MIQKKEDNEEEEADEDDIETQELAKMEAIRKKNKR